MTDWVDYFIYATFLFSIFFVYPWTLGMLSIPMLSDRNAQWVSENHKAIQSMNKLGSKILWLQFAGGAASIVVLTMMQLEILALPEFPEKWMLFRDVSAITGSALPQKWVQLWQFTTASMFISIIFFVVVAALMYFVWMRKVPVADKRQADLQRRSMNDFVPFPVKVSVYLLVLSMLAAWVVVAVLGWYEDPIFLKRLVSIFIVSGFMWFTAAYSVRRRPNVLDRLFGLGYRRGEVLLAFSCLLLPMVIGSVRLYEELSDVIVVNINRSIFLGTTLYVTLWILWIGYLVASNLQVRGGANNSLVNVK